MMKTLKRLLQGLDIIETRGDPGTIVHGIAYDSRKVRESGLFVAVRGARQDGHAFIPDAVRRGAHSVVAEQIPEEGLPPAWIRVADTRKALAQLAANFYDHPSRDFELIGVTGTNGKTTTTLLLESILEHAGCSVGVIGTLGYRWAGQKEEASMTTPESLDLQRLFHKMHHEVTHVVMEVSSHSLELGRVEGCVFRAGIFTNLSQDHLDFHGTMDGYFEAKSILFRNHIHSSPKASVAVINADDPYGKRLIEEATREVWSYSVLDSKARVGVRRLELAPTGISADLTTPEGVLSVHSPLMGRLNLYNLLAATTAALALGIPQEAVVRGLEALSLVDGRLQRVAIPEELGFEVVVDYAHTPDAMEKSLTCLREMTRGRLLVVFGCGGDRDRTKRPLMGEVAARIADLVILTSDNPRSEVPQRIIQDIEPGVLALGLPRLSIQDGESISRGYGIEVDRKKAIELALSWARPGDIVFIGGKGHETYQLIGGQKLPFDDRQVVQHYYDDWPDKVWAQERR